jgi:hypothetical protein
MFVDEKLLAVQGRFNTKKSFYSNDLTLKIIVELGPGVKGGLFPLI